MFNYPFMTTQINQMPSPQIQVFFVSSKDEAKNIQIQLNTMYVVINKQHREVYLKKLNNDGNIEFETYVDESVMKKQEDFTLFFSSLNEKVDNLHNILTQRNNTNNQQNNRQQNQNNKNLAGGKNE